VLFYYFFIELLVIIRNKH